MEFRTKRYGSLTIADGVCLLPPDETLPSGGMLDFIEVDEDAPELTQVAALLDRLPDLVSAARTQMAEAPEAIDFIPGWLEEETPKVFAKLFPDAGSADDVDLATVIAAFHPARLWVGSDDEAGTTLTVDFVLSDELDQVYGAYFALADGRLLWAAIES